MKNTTLTWNLALALALGMTAPALAHDHTGTGTGTGTGTSTTTGKAHTHEDESAGKAKDNTGRNKRDREAGAITADKQSNAKRDLKLTAEIRRAITKDKSLSMNARNIKVITLDGKVTLRGPVANADQKKAIETKAEEIAGAGAVTSELEVKAKE